MKSAEEWLIELDFDNYEKALTEVQKIQSDAHASGRADGLREAVALIKKEIVDLRVTGKSGGDLRSVQSYLEHAMLAAIPK